MPLKRLDQFLVSRQLAESRTRAQALIEAGRDKPTVIALREIASGRVGLELLNRGQT